MKKSICLILLFLGIIPATEGQKCQYLRNELYPPHGHQVTEVDPVVIATQESFHSISVGAKKYDNRTYLTFFYAGITNITIDQGYEILLTTSQDEIITLKFEEFVMSDFVYNGDLKVMFYSLNTSIFLYDEEVEQLKNSKITRIRWYSKEGSKKDDIKGKKRKYISGILKCLDKALVMK